MIDTTKWIDELDQVDHMTSDELRDECRQLAARNDFLSLVARVALQQDGVVGVRSSKACT